MGYIPGYKKVFETLSVIPKATYCFLLVYISLVVFSGPIYLLIVWRAFLSLIFKVVYGGKYEIMDSSDAPWTMDTYANLYTITFFMEVKGVCDIDKLRERLASNLLKMDENGRRPFGILLKAAVQKFGFTCWEDKSNSVDFFHHVRACPGAGDENQIYTEDEVFDAVAELADEEWDQDKPRWEVLVTPKVTLDMNINEDSEVFSVICVKILHVYVDGISFVQVLRNCIFDQPPPKFIFDPVSPLISPTPLYKKLLLYIQIFFLGPYYSLRIMGNSTDHIFYEGPLTGQKMFGRTKMIIPLEMMRRIRKKYKCTTQAILNSAFTAALQNMAKKKGLEIPKDIIVGIVYGRFPYPDEFPRNAAMFGYEPIPIGFTDPALRLTRVDEAIKRLGEKEYALWSSLVLVKIIGLCPACIIRAMMGSLHCAYFISNVPGVASIAKLNGNVVENVYGAPLIINGIRYAARVGYYNYKFTACFMFEKSQVIGCRKEVDEFIQEFEDEIKYFADHV